MTTFREDELGWGAVEPGSGGYAQAKEGFRFVGVAIVIKEGVAPQDFYEWPLSLQDAQGNLYPETFHYGVGNDTFRGFTVPNEVKDFFLILPDDVSVDLASLIDSN